MAGGHQLTNLALALRAAEEFCALGGRNLDPEAARRGLEAVQWPGRLEWVEIEVDAAPRRVLFDAAHNPAGAAALRSYLDEAGLEFDLLYGALTDKQPERCLPQLAEPANRIFLTAPKHRRAASPESLLPLLKNSSAVVDPDAASALDRCLDAPADPPRTLVVTGSLYLVGEVRTALRARCGAPPAARDLVTGYRSGRHP